MHAELDHLVVTAPTLAAGAAFVAQALGVQPQPGGEHPLMGTHNLVLRLGSSSYLEVIAINPAAARPGRTRWFALDDLRSDSTPQLTTWVARTSNLDSAETEFASTLGNVERMTRGSLRWRITIRADGSLPHNGLIPALIEWQTPVHPASSMRESGCSLTKIEGYHAEPDLLRQRLGLLGLDGALSVSALQAAGLPHLVAHIDTPTGPRSLGV